MIYKILSKNACQRLNFRHLASWIATFGGSGLISPASGTWGTLAALPFGIYFLNTGGASLLLSIAVLFFILGLWASKHVEQMMREKDSGNIVVDEAVGLWIALIPSLYTNLSIALAFILFRIFDILKPFPIGWLDKRYKGAMGVMIDDVVAGIYAAFILIGLRYAGWL